MPTMRHSKWSVCRRSYSIDEMGVNSGRGQDRIISFTALSSFQLSRVGPVFLVKQPVKGF